MRRSDCKFSVILKICFESIKSSKIDAISEKKLIKITWVID